MANDEHVAMLKQGVAAWNAWRDENRNVLHPKLYGADLPRANLTGANLNGADLTGANLTNAVLRWANLQMATLVNTILRARTEITESIEARFSLNHATPRLVM